MSFLKFPQSRLLWHLVLFGCLALIILAYQYPSLQDFPQWMYHGYVFEQLVFHGNNFNGFFSLHPYIPPNACATFIIAIFDLMVDPTLAAKLFLLLSMGLVYWGALQLLRTLTHTDSVLFLFIAAYSTLNLFFYMGFLNFLFGLGLALLTLNYVLRNGPNTKLLVLALLFLAIYLSHFASLLILGIALIVYVWKNRNSRLLLRFGLASIPWLILFIHYNASKSISVLENDLVQASYMQSVVSAFIHLPAPVMPIHRIKHVFEPGLLADLINYSFAFLLFASFAFVLWKTHRHALSFISLLLLSLIAVIVLTPAYIGGILNLGERFVPLFWVALLAAMYNTVGPALGRKLFGLSIVVCLLISYVGLFKAFQFFNDIDAKAQPASLGQYDPRGGSNPYTHFHYYESVRIGTPERIFHTGILTYRGADETKPF